MVLVCKDTTSLNKVLRKVTKMIWRWGGRYWQADKGVERVWRLILRRQGCRTGFLYTLYCKQNIYFMEIFGIFKDTFSISNIHFSLHICLHFQEAANLVKKSLLTVIGTLWDVVFLVGDPESALRSAAGACRDCTAQLFSFRTASKREWVLVTHSCRQNIGS